MDGWYSEDPDYTSGRGQRLRMSGGLAPSEEEYPGRSHRRRSGGGRRRSPGRGITWPTALVLVLIAAIAAGTYFWLSRPEAPEQAASSKVAMDSYLAVEGTGVITVSLGLRNASTEQLTVVGARFVPPEGLTVAGTATLASNRDGSATFDPDADLPASTQVDLAAGKDVAGATVAGRFTVDCTALGESPYGEQIFVTLRQGRDEWEQELAPPVLGTGDEPWLYATAKSMCASPTSSGAP